MSNKTEEIALARLGLGLAQPQSAEDRQIQAGIDATMREVIATRSHSNPQQLNPAENVVVGGAGRVVDASSKAATGWIDEKPLTLPPGQEIIERIVNAYLPGPKRTE